MHCNLKCTNFIVEFSTIGYKVGNLCTWEGSLPNCNIFGRGVLVLERDLNDYVWISLFTRVIFIVYYDKPALWFALSI